MKSTLTLAKTAFAALLIGATATLTGCGDAKTKKHGFEGDYAVEHQIRDSGINLTVTSEISIGSNYLKKDGRRYYYDEVTLEPSKRKSERLAFRHGRDGSPDTVFDISSKKQLELRSGNSSVILRKQ